VARLGITAPSRTFFILSMFSILTSFPAKIKVILQKIFNIPFGNSPEET
jgi:hypothetical protein